MLNTYRILLEKQGNCIIRAKDKKEAEAIAKELLLKGVFATDQTNWQYVNAYKINTTR